MVSAQSEHEADQTGMGQQRVEEDEQGLNEMHCITAYLFRAVFC